MVAFGSTKDHLRRPGGVLLPEKVHPSTPPSPGQASPDRPSMEAHHEEVLELIQRSPLQRFHPLASPVPPVPPEVQYPDDLGSPFFRRSRPPAVREKLH